MKNLIWIIREVLPFWPRVLLALSLSALTISSHIGLMATSSYLLTRAALQPAILDLMVTIVGVRFFGISRAVFRYLERLVSHDITFRILSRLRVRVYKGIEPFAPAHLGDFRSGDLLSRIVGDVEVQQNLFLRVLAPPMVAALVLVGYGVFLATFDVKFTFILAGFFLLAGVGIPFIIKGLAEGVGEVKVILKSKLHILAFDLIQGMVEVLTYGQDQKFKFKLKELQNELNQTERKNARITGLMSALQGLVMNLGMWTALILGIQLIEGGQLNGLYLGMLALGTLSSFEAVLPLPLAAQHYEENEAAGKRLWEVISKEGYKDQDKVRRVIELENNRSNDVVNNRINNNGIYHDTDVEDLCIEFSNVYMRYDEKEPWVLENVSFKVPAQRRIALVGPSGAGKTSVVNALLCFWDYQEGTIKIGGLDIKDLDPDQVRSLIGVVTQRTHLFHVTVKENLLLAKPDASDEELFEAAKKAKIHDFILTLPQGYDTVIGEEGMKLSGGQQQRLAIARVILKNAPILILDEATKGLDPVIEKDILKEIFALMHGRTILVISHHVKALKGIDKVLIMDKGQVHHHSKLD